MSGTVTAIILAAGEGTRMKSAHPKVAHKMLDKPLVWWVVQAAKESICERIIVVVGNGADEVRSIFAEDNSVEFVEQTERLGTGHAVRIARDAIGGFAGPVVVLSGDAPLINSETITALVEHNMSEHFACTVLTMAPPDPSGYGRIALDSAGQVQAIIEDKDCTPEQREELTQCNSGVYCFCGGRLSANIDKLTTENAQGEYYLTDMVGIYREMGEPVSSLLCEDYRLVLGVNSRVQLAEATRHMQQRINEHHMMAGVSMLDPTSVWIGPEVEIGRDTEILPSTMLFGTTTIGENCTVGPNTRLTNVTVGNNCMVDETVGIDSTLDDNVDCGPRAYLRPGTHLMQGAKAGTHVELKNAQVGPGSKVPHLSYIGDATIGEDTNIGAGTITCNYDGVNKNRTTIGSGVFIGSDTMLVAPVSVGDGATTGAASAITKDVPAGALAVERSQQTIIEGYSTRKAEAQLQHKSNNAPEDEKGE